MPRGDKPRPELQKAMEIYASRESSSRPSLSGDFWQTARLMNRWDDNEVCEYAL